MGNAFSSVPDRIPFITFGFFFVCVYVYICMFHGTYMEVRATCEN